MTLLELRTEFDSLAPDSPVSDTVQTTWANLGQIDIVRRTKCLPTSGSIDIVGSTANYDLTTNFTDYLEIDYDGGVQFYDGTDYTTLKKVNQAWLDRNVIDWRNSDEDDPRAYYFENKYIYLYPTPGASYTGGLLVHYIQKPTDMSADSSEPFDSRVDLEPYHELILNYMLYRAKRGIGEFLQAREYYQEYLRGVERMKIELGEREEVIDEPFLPYTRKPVSLSSDPALWGVK